MIEAIETSFTHMTIDWDKGPIKMWGLHFAYYPKLSRVQIPHQDEIDILPHEQLLVELLFQHLGERTSPEVFLNLWNQYTGENRDNFFLTQTAYGLIEQLGNPKNLLEIHRNHGVRFAGGMRNMTPKHNLGSTHA